MLKLYGISNVQIAPTTLIEKWDNLSNLDLSSFYDIKVTSLQSIAYGIVANIFKDNIDLFNHIKLVIDFASKYKIKTLVFGCPKNRNKDDEDYISKFILFFRELGDYCIDKNVYICLEPNSIQYTNFLNNIDDTGEMVRLINHPNIKLMVDIGHVNNIENRYKFRNDYK